LLEWESCPGAGAEEKLSFLSTAIDELHRRQIPFTLQLPGVNLFKPENKNAVSKAAYTHQCLRALAEFNHPNSSNENLQTMA
jgi:2'-5' RNA ligase